jgi:hypothetical protein
MALIGDSHASHWRAALDAVATASHLYGISITHSACPYSAAVKLLAQPGRGRCTRWREQLRQWFARHPEIGTVFVGEINSHIGVITRPGEDQFTAKAAGYRAAWHELPRSVEHILVLRDTPTVPVTTPNCVARAVARRREPGLACAVPRRDALPGDPAVAAAARWPSQRVQVLDLTRFFCGRTRCYPVIGGALVYKDISHLTRVFATTLGPYLRRATAQLMRGWRLRAGRSAPIRPARSAGRPRDAETETRCVGSSCAAPPARRALTAGVSSVRNGPVFTVSYVKSDTPSGVRIKRFVVLVNPHDGGMRRVPAGGPIGELRLSPDRTRLAVETPRGISVADLRGRHPHLLVRHGMHAAWSSDGRRLAVLTPSRLIVVGADGHGARVIARGKRIAGPIVWAPGDERIALIRRPAPDQIPASCNGRSEIALVPIRGGRLRTLYSPPFRCGAAEDFDFAPDGRRLVVDVSDATAEGQPRDPRAPTMVGLDVINPHTGSLHRIATDTFTPSWSPDGTAIAFMSYDCPQQRPGGLYLCLRSVQPRGGAIRTLALIRNDIGAESPVSWLTR